MIKYRARFSINDNYFATYWNGITTRYHLVDDNSEIKPLKYPEFYDIHLTDFCMGECRWCYMNSNDHSTHAENAIQKLEDFFGPMSVFSLPQFMNSIKSKYSEIDIALKNLMKIIKKDDFTQINDFLVDQAFKYLMTSGFKDKIISELKKYPENQRPLQVACLDSKTPIFGDFGMKYIKDVKIGDLLYNGCGGLSSVKNVIKRKRKCIKITGNRGFSIICTPDHPFIVDGEIVEAKDLLDKKIDKIQIDSHINKEICLLPYINKISRIKNKKGGSSGGKVLGENCRLSHNTPIIPHTIKLSEDIMWLYGLTVAEGDYRGLTLGPEEQNIAEKALKIYNDFLGLRGSISRPKPNVIRVNMFHRHLFKIIFFKIMGIGSPANNKSISFLFGLEKNLIKSAIRGMFEGDGCYRKKIVKNNNYAALSYKTSSKKIAYELAYLLNTVFDIGASIDTSENKEREIEGRVLPKTKYYNVSIYGKKNISKIFPDIIENDDQLKHVGESLYSYKAETNSSIIIKKIEDAGVRFVYDITLDDNSDHIFTLSHGVKNHNCGGGNPNQHPNFVKILEKLDELQITPNYTTNGMGLTDEILEATQKYCGGVALSCHPHLREYWESGVKKLLATGVKLSYHHIIGDKDSVERFINIFEDENLDGMVSYHVLLPLIAQGRSKSSCEKEATEILFNYLEKLDPERQQKVAFGARFYEDLLVNKLKLPGVSIYGPEDFSKFLHLKSMNIYGSSFEFEKGLPDSTSVC